MYAAHKHSAHCTLITLYKYMLISLEQAKQSQASAEMVLGACNKVWETLIYQPRSNT